MDYDRRAKRARRQAYQDWFASDFAWTHQLTIAYQRAVELPEMTRVLRTILQWYDRRALGRYYLRKTDQRVLAIAIPEMLGSKSTLACADAVQGCWRPTKRIWSACSCALPTLPRRSIRGLICC